MVNNLQKYAHDYRRVYRNIETCGNGFIISYQL